MWKHVWRHVVSRCVLTWILGAEARDNSQLRGYYNLPHIKITSRPGGARCVRAATGKQTPVRPYVPTVTSGRPAICQIYHMTSDTFGHPDTWETGSALKKMEINLATTTS